ncbi:hypothetical protein [Paramicrobacterium agarici]|uniref:hypothetical protein n=1 Tax=Paramicrobacterium agarici TaxID=630514 RepID=UPI0011519319|nr:hypothetical protein [Microbacterium agarici]TQO22399.1 hypothetical protein FB385_1229 [Microbacterium agarici]
MTNQSLWQQPASPARPASVPVALLIAAFPAGMALLNVLISLFSFGMRFDDVLLAIFGELLPTLLFAGAAFLSLAFIKPAQLNGPVAALAVPVLIAGGIGGALLVIYRYLYATIRTLAIDGGSSYGVNLGAVVGNLISLTLVLALGAVIVRGRRWSGELAAGVPDRRNVVPPALIIAAAVLVDAVVVSVLSVGMLLVHGHFVQLVIIVLRAVLCAAAAFVVLAAIWPLSKISSLGRGLVAGVIAGGVSLVLALILDLIVGAVQGSLEFFFPYTVVSSLWTVIDAAVVVALGTLVVLAVRGQRVFTGRAPQPAQPGWQPQPPPVR